MRGAAGFPLRVRWAKNGPIRFISHRDTARAFERALRVERVALSFTQGFSPRPKVSFGPALALGYESDAEYIDVELTEVPDLAGLPAALSASLPEGLDVTGVAELASRAPALQESVTALGYRVEVALASGSESEAVARVTERVTAALDRPELRVARTRKGREAVEDIRPALRRLAVIGGVGGGGVLLDLEVSTQPRGVRPREVVVALGDDLGEVRARRTHQWIERGGARLEPLEADPRPRVLEARAS